MTRKFGHTVTSCHVAVVARKEVVLMLTAMPAQLHGFASRAPKSVHSVPLPEQTDTYPKMTVGSTILSSASSAYT